ncbi:MAG: peroxidase-related enzyme [Granulosicoccaceae bacterium]
MSKPPLFPRHNRPDLPADIQQRMDDVEQKAGFVPEVFNVFSRRPDEFRAFFAYHDALMEKDSELSKGEREMIVVATSALNRCLYCVIAHGAITRIREKAPRLADQLATDYRKADITPRQLAMLEFACKLSQQPAQINQSDFDELTSHGFSQEAIWDIGAVSAFFALSNRMASLTDMRPNDEFYSMGR